MVELNAEVAINDMAIPASVDAPGPLFATYEPASGGLSNDIKQAILDCFTHVAWVDPEGADYYQILHDLFFPPTELVRITAVYTQSGTVYPSTSLDSLKSDLVVKAVYSDGTTETLASTDYTLSGTLTVGTSTVTVSYSGKTTSFTVTVSAVPVVASISAVYTQSGTVYDTDSLDSLKADLVVTATYTDSSTETVPSADYTLSGTLTAGTSTVTVTYASKTTTFTVTVTHQSTTQKVYFSDLTYNEGYLIKLNKTTASVGSGAHVIIPYVEGMSILTIENSSWTGNYKPVIIDNGSTYTDASATQGELVTAGIYQYTKTFTDSSGIVNVVCNFAKAYASSCYYEVEV